MIAQTFIVFFFGFPGAFLSLLLSVIGILKDKYWLVLLGAVLFIPFSYYLNGSPNYRGFAILLPLFQIGSAAAVRAQKSNLAWLLLLPAVGMTLWFLGIVLFFAFWRGEGAVY